MSKSYFRAFFFFFLFFKTDRFLCFFVNIFPLQNRNTRIRYVINRSSQQPKQVMVRLTKTLSSELSHLQLTSAKVILKCFLMFRNRCVSLKLTTYQSCLWIANFSSRNLSLLQNLPPSSLRGSVPNHKTFYSLKEDNSILAWLSSL